MKAFYDKPDAELATGSATFSALLTGQPGTYNVSAPQAASYAALDAVLQTSYAAAIDPATRTSAAIAGKNTARTAVVRSARGLAKLIKSSTTVTNEQLIALGLTPRSSPVPAPIPTTAPILEVEKVTGSSVLFRVHDSASSRRSKPAGVTGCMVYSYVGQTVPSDINAWTFGGLSTRNKITLPFPSDLPAFSRVWLTALWVNGRGETGPACTPVATNLGTWTVQAASTTAETTLKAA